MGETERAADLVDMEKAKTHRRRMDSVGNVRKTVFKRRMEVDDRPDEMGDVGKSRITDNERVDRRDAGKRRNRRRGAENAVSTKGTKSGAAAKTAIDVCERHAAPR